MQRLILGLILASILWAVGLAGFIGGLPTPSGAPSTSPPQSTDGIAVYTGGGGARIIAGMSLFAQGAGDRLLISGVNPGTSRARISELWNGEVEQFNCCVDLGRKALSTQGNATEVMNWVDTHDYRSLIIVTSEYHMPRALAASRAQMPGVAMHSYVVASGYLDEKGRPNSIHAWAALAGEYSKYLIAKTKAFFSFKGQ